MNHLLLELPGLPVYQNKMFDSHEAARACPRGDLVLAQDSRTGLISNVAFDSSLLEYDGTYQNEQGHSAAFQNHLSEVLAAFERNFRNKSLIEIGCGKGAFLEQLVEHKYDVRGLDPAYEGNSPRILKAFFVPDLGIRGEVVIMRHVLEHVRRPVEFLHSIQSANHGNGLIYIEVPCFDWILQRRAWFDVFYEHVNYFRLDDVERMFGTVIESGRLFGGQYIYVVADLATLRGELAPGRPARVPEGFFSSIERCLSPASAEIRQKAIWGAAAKGVMFAHHLSARGTLPDCAIDINPAKQGKYLAGSGLLVRKPSEALATLMPNAEIFVMNSNYLDEIRAAAGPTFNYVSVDQL